MKVDVPKFAFNYVTIVALLKGAVAFSGMMINGLVGYIILKLSLNKATNFNYQYTSAFFCRLIMLSMGVRVKYPKKSDYPKKKVLYIFNHNSYLDIFLIPSMRIPNCRYIINEHTNSILPLYLSNTANGAILIPKPKNLEGREKFFRDTTTAFRDGDNSIFASPEGVHTFDHHIAPFNQGIFKMAMEAGVDICPIFFDIEKENNPFQNFFFKSGEVKFEVLPVISTKDWTLDNLDQKINEVRNIFVNKFNSRYGENIS